MTQANHEVIIIGAGPAGSTAAILLAQAGRRVALVDRDRFPRAQTSAGWLNSRCAPLLAELQVPVRSLLDHAFRQVTFHNADFTKSARPNFADAPGYLVDRAEFDNIIVETARKSDVTMLLGVGVSKLHLKESSVSVDLTNGNTISGRLLIIATGAGSALVENVGVVRPKGSRPVWMARVDAEPGTKKGSKSEPHVDIVLGLNRHASFGLICTGTKRISATITWKGERDEALPALVNLCRLAHQHGHVPVDLSIQAASAPLMATPGSAALEMETHVGKHSLVIGDAGGFVAAASHEGIYPAMWSGQIAAKILDAALKSTHSQDVLMTFNSEWRLRMADYLRSPNTDIQFLLPLIFSNQAMADRMGGAFFSGENI